MLVCVVMMAVLAVSRQKEASAGLKLMDSHKTSSVAWVHLSDAGKYYGTDKAQSSHNFVAVYEAEDFSSSPAARGASCRPARKRRAR